MKWQPSLSLSSKVVSDPQDPRLIDLLAQKSDAQTRQARLWGYCDDEGISLNGGRPGARLAPAEIRRFLYRMTPSLDFDPNLRILDLGDLSDLQGSTLAERHNAGKLMATNQFASKNLCLSLGAGHDYGYADGAGFLEAYSGASVKPVILNVDAHLDVRPTDKGFHSGTPFRRLLEDYAGKFQFIELGLQPQCNSLHHAEWLKSQGAESIWIDEIRANTWTATLQKVLKLIPTKAPLWISFDIDAISNADAPGCSQSWATGLSAQESLELIHSLAIKTNLAGLSIYEVSPPLDTQFKTTKLAALLAYQALRFHQKNPNP